MDVVSYARYSSDMQSESSIITQQAAIRKYCGSNGYKLIKEFSDAALSGTDVSHRYGFQEMINYVCENKIDAVVVYTRDRFSRNINDFLRYLEVLDHYNCRLLCVNGMNDDTPSSKLSEWINIALSEFYIKNLSRKVKRGMKYNVQVGKFNGGMDLLGYDIDYKTKKFLINPKEAEAVKIMFDLFIKGYSYTQIENYLYDNGYKRKNGKPIRLTNRNLLCNKKYIGTHHQEFIEDAKKEEVIAENVIPPIIDKETFNRTQEILDKRRGKSIRVYQSLLSGIIICGYTGAAICETSVTKHPFGTRTTIYQNSTKAKFKRDQYAKPITGNVLNDYVLCLVEETLLSEKNVSIIHKFIKNIIDKKVSKIVKEINNLESEYSLAREHYIFIVHDIAKATEEEQPNLINKLEIISTKLNNFEIKKTELNSQLLLLPSLTKEQLKIRKVLIETFLFVFINK